MTIPTNTGIAGKLKIDIECAGKVIVAGLSIYKIGVVKGSIFSKKLVIEEGAKCNLQMTVGEHKKPVLFKEESFVSDAVG